MNCYSKSCIDCIWYNHIKKQNYNLPWDIIIRDVIGNMVNINNMKKELFPWDIDSSFEECEKIINFLKDKTIEDIDILFKHDKVTDSTLINKKILKNKIK